MVRLVKTFENGFITNPVCLSPTNTVQDVMDIKDSRGFCGIPITASGCLNSQLLGIVTSRDIDFYIAEHERKVVLADIMTVDLVTAKEGISLKEANAILQRSHKGTPKTLI